MKEKTYQFNMTDKAIQLLLHALHMEESRILNNESDTNLYKVRLMLDELYKAREKNEDSQR